MRKFIVALLLAILSCVPATAQRPPINGVAGPTTPYQLDSILTQATGFYTVPTIAALQAVGSAPGSPHNRPALVYVQGLTAPNDGGGGVFYWAQGDTSRSDNFMVVTPTLGQSGQWLRLWLNEVQAAWFGCKLDGVTDDTACWAAAALYSSRVVAGTVTAMNMNAPGITFSGTTLTCQFAADNFSVVDGHGNAGTFKYCSTLNPDTAVVAYRGSGAIVFQNFNCVGPAYTSNVQPAHGGGCILYVPSDTTVTGGPVTIRNIWTTGGAGRAVHIGSASDIWVDGLHCVLSYQQCLNITSTFVTQQTKVQHIYVNNFYSRASGYSAFTFPDNENDPSPNFATTPRDIYVRAVVDGAGFFNSNGPCGAMASGGQDQVDLEITGQNCLTGGLSIKRNVSLPNVIPSRVANQRFHVTYHTNFDSSGGFCGSLTYDEVTGTYIAGSYNQSAMYVDCTFAQAGQWLASTYYQIGDVVYNTCPASSGICNYMAVQTGTSASSGGPQTQTAASLTTDGTVGWLWMGNVPQASAGVQTSSGLSCLRTNGPVTDVLLDGTCYGMAHGYRLQVNFAGDSIARITARVRGTITGSAFWDDASAGAATVTDLWLDNWQVHSLGTAAPSPSSEFTGLLMFGDTSMTYQNVNISGGTFQLDTKAAPCFIQRQSTSTIANLKITGAPNFQCQTAMASLVGTVSAIWSGGGLIDVKAHSGTVFQTTGTPSGTWEVSSPVRVKTNAAVGTGDFRCWLVGGGTLTISASCDRGYSASYPASTACQIGDFFHMGTPASGAENPWVCVTASTSAGTFSQSAGPLYSADTGTGANVYRVVLPNGVTNIALVPVGFQVTFIAANANTAASTLSINAGTTTKAITKSGTTALAANDIVVGMAVALVWDGTEWLMTNPRVP